MQRIVLHSRRGTHLSQVNLEGRVSKALETRRSP